MLCLNVFYRDHVLVRIPFNIWRDMLALVSFHLAKRRLNVTEADSGPPYFKTTQTVKIVKMEPRAQMVALMLAQFAIY